MNLIQTKIVNVKITMYLYKDSQLIRQLISSGNIVCKDESIGNVSLKHVHTFIKKRTEVRSVLKMYDLSFLKIWRKFCFSIVDGEKGEPGKNSLENLFVK